MLQQGLARDLSYSIVFNASFVNAKLLYRVSLKQKFNYNIKVFVL